MEDAQRFLARASALLIGIGLLTGGLVAFAMTGKIQADTHSVLAAHLNALLGSFWMLGVAWTLPRLRYSAAGRRRLAWLVVIPNYANWAVTLGKAFWKVSGVEANGNVRNDLVFGALGVLVIVPSIAAAAAWFWGLRKE